MKLFARSVGSAGLALGLIATLALLPLFLGSVRSYVYGLCLVPAAIGLTLWFWGPAARMDALRLRQAPLRRWILIALGAFFVSALFSKAPFLLPFETAKVLGGWLVYEATVHYGQSRHQRYRLAQFTLLYAAALSVFGILQLLGAFPKTWWHQEQFLSGPYMNHNHFAGFLEIALPIGVGLSISEREASKKMLYLFASVIAMLAFVLTLSRGGFVALAVAMIFMFVCLAVRRTVLPSLPVLLGVAFLLTGMLMFFGTESLNERIKTFQTMDGLGELSVRYRWITWQGAIAVFKSFPVAGGGPGAFEFLFLRLRPEAFPGRPVYAHNDWLQLLADQGVVGFAAVAVLFGAFFVLAREVIDRDDSRFRIGIGVGAAAGILALCVHGLFDFNFHIPANWIWACFAAGLVHSFAERHPFAPAAKWKRVVKPLAALAWAVLLGGLAYFVWTERDARAAAAAYEVESKAASASVARALRVSPYNPELHYLQARLLAKDDRKAALAAIDRAIHYNPYEPVFERFRARLLAAPGAGGVAGDELVDAFRRALEKDPRNARLHLLVAKDLYRASGSPNRRPYLKAALPILAKAVDLEPALSEQAGDLLLRYGLTAPQIQDFMMARPEKALSGYLEFLKRRQLWKYYRKPFLKLHRVDENAGSSLHSEETPFKRWTLQDFSQAGEGEPIRQLALWHSDGELQKEVRVENGCRRVLVRAKGVYSGGAYPFLILRYGGRVIDAFYVDSKVYKNYDAWVAMSLESRILSLEYANDWAALDEGKDRNVWIQRVELYRPLVEGAC